MPQAPTSGAFGYINYGFESTYGTVAASFPRSFGHGAKLTVDRKNNMERIHGAGARNATANVAKKYEGNYTVEFNLDAGETTIAGGASWFRAVMGAIPTDGGATPYTHTYTETNALASFSIANGIELGTNDSVAALIGCKAASTEISFAVDEVARVKISGPYRTESMAVAGIGSAVAPVGVPFTFAHATLSVAGTPVGYVQSGTLTVNHDIEMLWGAGSRYSTAGPEKTRKYDFKGTVAFSDVTLLMEKLYGTTVPMTASALATLNPAGVAMVMTFDNGLTVINMRKIVLTFANFYIDAHTLPTDVNEIIKEDVTGYALSCTNVVVSNATATDVASP